MTSSARFDAHKASAVDLDRVRAFLAVVDAGTFAAAADRLGVGQPAVSRRVAALEAAVGASLLHRTSRSIRLTAAGEAAVGPGRALLDAAGALGDAVAAVSRRGTVTVGVTSHTTHGHVATLLAAVAAVYPELDIAVESLRSADVATAVRDGVVDLALARPAAATEPEPPYAPLPGLVIDPLAGVPLHVAVPVAHPLARERELRLSALAGQPAVLVRRDVWPAGFDASLRQLEAAGAAPSAVVEAPSPAGALELVAAGRGLYRTAVTTTRVSGVHLVRIVDHWAPVGLVRPAAPQEPIVRGVAYVVRVTFPGTTP